MTDSAPSDPICMLHFADTHIGMENYGRTDPETGLSSRVMDFLKCMEEMIDYARAQDVDLVVFAGMRSNRAVRRRPSSASSPIACRTWRRWPRSCCWLATTTCR